MSLAVATTHHADDHDTGLGHPERRGRTAAAWDGLIEAGLADLLLTVAPRAATSSELHRVHTASYLGWLETFCAAGGGHIDAETSASPGSWETALVAAGAGLATADALRSGQAEAGLVLARPPGHHAEADRAMGFCLINNVAVTAAAIRASGERVAVIDIDVHHGNGTQRAFWDDAEVLYVSLHERGLWPHSGRIPEVGGPAAQGTTLNVPLPEGSAGPAVRRAFELLVEPTVAAFAPDWVLVSAGFDGHRADPLADWLLSTGDYGEIGRRLRRLAGGGRLLSFLEGGYDLDALAASVGAFAAGTLDLAHGAGPLSDLTTGVDDVETIARWRSTQPWWAPPEDSSGGVT